MCCVFIAIFNSLLDGLWCIIAINIHSFALVCQSVWCCFASRGHWKQGTQENNWGKLYTNTHPKVIKHLKANVQ